MFKKAILLLVISGIICLGAITTNRVTNAVSASDWKASNIIDDSIFIDADSMSVSQIQSFLNNKVPVCDTMGTNGSTTTSRRDYVLSLGLDVPITCLKDFYEVPKTTPGPGIPANNYGGKPIPAGAKSAAQLIWNAAQKYSISPKVLLVKLGTESAGPLTSDDWPLLSQYTYAMGAQCPDSGPNGTANCNTNYSGFSIQIAEAAKMLRGYLDNMDQPWYQYKRPGPGVTLNGANSNYVGWNIPESGCGGTVINIANKATAALYTYTPYQPNKAALNNMYGLGDGCSAYGNRNFWRVYNDWFGSSQYGDLVKTTSSATVYLISDGTKYPIADGSILNALSSLGKVDYVTQDYLDSKTTGKVLGRLIISSSGTIYYFDAGIKLPFKTCAQVADYGYDCNQPTLLTDYLIGALSNGPSMTNVLQTTNGKKFYIKSGEKKEIYDGASLQKIGVSANSNTLNESAISNLKYGTPVIRDDVIVTSRETDNKYISQNGQFIKLSTYLVDSSAFSKLPDNKLDNASINTLTINKNFNGFAQDSTGKKYVIDSYGKTLLSSPEEWLGSYTTLTDTLLGLMPNSTQPINSRFVKVNGESTIYIVIKGKKYSIPSWKDFINLHLDKSAKWASLPKITSDSIPTIKSIYAPGNLVKSSTSAAVYVVNGLLHKVALSSFAISDDFGLSGVITIPQSYLNIYTTDSGNLNNFVVCGSKKYLANRGIIYEIDAKASTMYGYDSVVGSAWDDIGCANLDKSSRLLSTYLFIKVDGSKTIYFIKDGKKHPVSSMTKYNTLGGSSSKLLIVSRHVLDTITNGSSV